MRHAKSGSWWDTTPWRALANNSACYTEKPGMEVFMREWLSLYESKSGERGFFNREAVVKWAEKFERRDPNHEFGCNPCSEIVLRSCGLCNLSEVVVRAGDKLEDLKKKVKVATILGTMQATLTDFRYLREKWRENAEDEALLGVSLTGIMDNELMAGRKGKKKLVETLAELRDYAVEVNKEWSEIFGIKQAAAVTCVKPSGTVSQLVDCASGIHSRYSPYYIRRVRADKKDPLATLMQEMGFPCEPDVMKPDTVLVFSFPVKSPDGALVTEDVPSLDHLDLWKVYQLHWCEHKPSITIHLRESEWMEAGAWVFRNFDIVSGISFLPYSGHSYAQAPYEECTEEQYIELLASMPEHIDWTQLSNYEKEDQTVGSKTYACSGDACEVVDLTKD
jgi:ribonucleoside-diphosphate reductase alpha chain